jgi:hypothetical protein
MYVTGRYLESLPKISAPHPSLDENGIREFGYRLPAGSSGGAGADHEHGNGDEEQNDTNINGADEFSEFG